MFHDSLFFHRDKPDSKCKVIDFKYQLVVIIEVIQVIQFNLDSMQKEVRERHNDFPGIPIIYFTQLLGLSLGLPVEKLDFGRNDVDPRPLLEGKGLI